MNKTINPVRRIALCDYCHPGTCARCGATGRCHTESVYQDGRFVDQDVCADQPACWQRRGM